MTIHFGETFGKVQECFREPNIAELKQKLESITIIRDTKGKINLFLEPFEGQRLSYEDPLITSLGELLSSQLDKYYGQDIWFPEKDSDPYQALIQVVEEERVEAEWNNENHPKWYVLERHIAKQSWTNNNLGSPPWSGELVDQRYKPAIISFFSFKGGLGRTTSLVATALILARNGHRVAMIDLDLEAPGLATIFNIEPDENEGVIDYLLEYQIYENRTMLPVKTITWLGGEPLQLLPAGKIDNNYLEKLARLDFQNFANSGVQKNIQEMLEKLEREARPLDFILIDARAGFHDIGGLVISTFSHGAVVFGSQSRQSWAGLTSVIQHIGKINRNDEPLPLILVHSLAPSLGIQNREQVLEDFRDRAYSVFQENYYSSEEDVPNQNDDQEVFFPYEIPYNNDLRGDIALSSESPFIEILINASYQRVAERICNLFNRDFTRRS
jgi:cellulose biosynthesis protein BcsQ